MSETPEERLKAAGITLPPPPAPGFDYVAIRRFRDTAYVAAQIPKINGLVQETGRVPGDVPPERAGALMRLCALHGLAWLADELGRLDRVEAVLRVNAYVAAAPGFGAMSEIADEASGVLITAFGEAGRHVRTVLGVVELPRRSPVMMDMTVGLRSE